MSELVSGRYWCYECHRTVNPAIDAALKCPYCDGGFVEEMDSRRDIDFVPAHASDRSISPWAPLFLSMTGGPSRHSRSQREEEEEEEVSELNHEFQGFLRMRQRTSAILRLLQSLRDDFMPESENFQRERERDTERRGNMENMFLLHPSNQALVGHGSSDNDENQSENSSNVAGSMSGDFLVGPSLDLLLQHLAEINSSRRGTAPAKKEAVDALPTVKIQEVTGCSVCLDDFVIDAEAKEMPCKHKFHSDCILPWLELHCSCPVCRYLLPADESKIPSHSSNGYRSESVIGSAPERHQNPFSWPFGQYLSFPGSENDRNSSLNLSSTTFNNGTTYSQSEDN